MSTVSDPAKAGTLADESFMSADDLRSYMTELEMAKASKMAASMDKAEEARKKLVASLQQEIAVTPITVGWTLTIPFHLATITIRGSWGFVTCASSTKIALRRGAAFLRIHTTIWKSSPM